MKYEITTEREKYLTARGYTILTACPGSGKTTSIVYKLHTISKECQVKYGTYAGVACLSFTNKACDEILSKYKSMHDETLIYPHIVSTIDSFITQYVTLPFWYLFPGLEIRPSIVNDDALIDRILQIQYIKDGVKKETYTREITIFGHEYYTKYEPKNIWKECSGYSFKGTLITDPTFTNYARAVFKSKLERGFITSQDASYIGYYILHKHKEIAKALALKFPYIIIDEAQDTSELHHKIFDRLKECGVKNIEYIGDLYQSIYQWRNARPELLEDKIKCLDWTHLHLTENRRSNQRIIDLYSLLRKKSDPKIISYKVDDQGIDVLIYKYDKSNIKAIIDHFHSICQDKKLKNGHVLTRGNSFCRQIQGIVQELRYWKSDIPYSIIEAKKEFNNDSIDNSFDRVRHIVANCKFKFNEYKAKRNFIIESKLDNLFNMQIMRFLLNIPSLDLTLAEWTTNTEILLQKVFSLNEKPNFQIYKRIKGETMSILQNRSTKLYYSDQNNYKNTSLPVKTIHKVKGATFDAVLLFLSEKSSGKSISLNEFKKTVTALSEKQRLIYVACSRATQFLAFAVPTSIPDAEIIQKLGNNVIIKNINLQGSLF